MNLNKVRVVGRKKNNGKVEDIKNIIIFTELLTLQKYENYGLFFRQLFNTTFRSHFWSVGRLVYLGFFAKISKTERKD